jgi:hypothetical protein
MKHIVTISLVFFSLTHLAKAERVEGLKLLTERYCSEYKTNSTISPIADKQLNDDRNPYFLTYHELTLIGILSEVPILKYNSQNQVIADLTIRKKPKNNSP